MRTLGIDPGISFTGFAIVNGKKYIHSGAVKTKPSEIQVARVKTISDYMVEMAEHWKVQYVAIETLFGGRRTVHNTLELVGAIRLGMWNAGWFVEDIAPSQVKKGVGVSGHAKKPIVAAAVGKLLGINVARMTSHETDALAVCIAADKLRGKS